MAPRQALPHSADFSSTHEYVDSLLTFCGASVIFQTLCGGIHILDFFTREPSLYHTVIPEEWREWLMERDEMDLLGFLMRDDLHLDRSDDPPESLLKYVRDIRSHSLCRQLDARESKNKKLPRHVAVGMIPKKIHEVSNFADYVARVADDVQASCDREITHFVDFGSGQNYLGRTLASPPYNKHIVAVESRELNISGAKTMDVLAGVAEREKVMRNKKLFRAQQDNLRPDELLKEKELRRKGRAKAIPLPIPAAGEVDLRPNSDLATIYTPADGKGYIQYVEHRVQDGDLSDVVDQIEKLKIEMPTANPQVVDSEKSYLPAGVENTSIEKETRFMAISIHSCGNLSHHGIRSLIVNPSVQAIAIVGCCYNLMTERLGPPTFKLPLLRQNQRAINAPRVEREAAACDVHGFPMSERLATYNEDGIRLNITARMMAVQAPQNWTAKESDAFFTRHFYRALLQKVFLDFGVVSKMKPDPESAGTGLESTEPVIIGSLRKGCYMSFKTYVRGALEKLGQDPERSAFVMDRMGSITDAQIEEYSTRYGAFKKELSVTWSLMAFSAGVVESLVVVDRWLYLKEHEDIVKDAWVEPVFDYSLSPRNLVVVGIKR
jgi:hypothetical protein